MSFTRTRTFSKKASSATTYIAKPRVQDIVMDDLDLIMNSDEEEAPKKVESKVDKKGDKMVVIAEKKVESKQGDKENSENTSTPSKAKASTPSKKTPPKRATASTPTKDPTPPKKTRTTTPTKRTPTKNPSTTPTKTPPKKVTPKKDTPTKRTPTKKTTPSKLTRSASDGGGTKSPSRMVRTSTSVDESFYKTNKMVDELEYLFDGLEGGQSVMRDCIYKLAKMTRAGGQAISSALNSQGFITRLADILLLKWNDKKQSFRKDLPSVLAATITLHSLAKDSANVSPLTKCIPLLHNIIESDSWIPKDKDEEYTKVAKLVEGIQFANDYMQCGANSQLLALRTLAALTFTRQAIGDTLRTQGVIDSVITKLADLVSKINPKSPTIVVLADVKYALVFLENATTLSAENRAHIVEDGPLLSTLLQVMDIARNCMIESTESEGLLDAAADCINGALKSFLNITYNNDSACMKVAAGSDSDTKGNKGLEVLTSLLSLKFPGIEKFDIQQHTIGLLINLVEINIVNRKKFGFIEGAIECVVNLFLEAGLESESTSTTTTVEDLEELVEGKVKAAYAAMLLGCLLRDNSANLKTIRGLLAKHKIDSLSPLVHLLKQFVLFQAKAGILASDVYKSTQEIMQYIQSIEKPNNTNTNNTNNNSNNNNNNSSTSSKNK